MSAKAYSFRKQVEEILCKPDAYTLDGKPWYKPRRGSISACAMVCCADCGNSISGRGGIVHVRCPKCHEEHKCVQ